MKMLMRVSGVKLLVLALVGLYSIVPAYAGLYKWTDKNGTYHFSEEPPPENIQNFSEDASFGQGEGVRSENTGNGGKIKSFKTTIAKNGRKPIHDAAIRGDLDYVKQLIRNGANIDEPMPGKTTPLMCAIVSGNHELVKWFIENGANINLQTNPQEIGETNSTALHLAVWENDLYSAELLLSRKGSKSCFQCLHSAAARNNTEMMELLLDKKVVNLDARDIGGQFALMTACESGTMDSVKFLIERGANVNRVDNDKRTALYYAIRGGHPEIVDLLLANKADVNQKFAKGRGEYFTPLEQAIEKKNNRIITSLLKYGAKK